MSLDMPRQPGQPSVGRQRSFWMRHDIIDKLVRLATQRGVKPNKMMTILIEEAEEA